MIFIIYIYAFVYVNAISLPILNESVTTEWSCEWMTIEFRTIFCMASWPKDQYHLTNRNWIIKIATRKLRRRPASHEIIEKIKFLMIDRLEHFGAMFELKSNVCVSLRRERRQMQNKAKDFTLYFIFELQCMRKECPSVGGLECHLGKWSFPCSALGST